MPECELRVRQASNPGRKLSWCGVVVILCLNMRACVPACCVAMTRHRAHELLHARRCLMRAQPLSPSLRNPPTAHSRPAASAHSLSAHPLWCPRHMHAACVPPLLPPCARGGAPHCRHAERVYGPQFLTTRGRTPLHPNHRLLRMSMRLLAHCRVDARTSPNAKFATASSKCGTTF